ncbi:MAG: hypothetical protein P8008_07730 [Gammaproteobacteria bacterium]
MSHKPNLPASPSALPLQRLHAVVGLPPRPPGFQGFCSWVDDEPPELRGLDDPCDPVYLCQVEWAWSPMHGRIQACYLETQPEHWLLWTRFPDDEAGFDEWSWCLHAWADRIAGVADDAAAAHLLLDAWAAEARWNDLDRFHWMNEAGALDVAEVHAIARAVWPEAPETGEAGHD